APRRSPSPQRPGPPGPQTAPGSRADRPENPTPPAPAPSPGPDTTRRSLAPRLIFSGRPDGRSPTRPPPRQRGRSPDRPASGSPRPATGFSPRQPAPAATPGSRQSRSRGPRVLSLRGRAASTAG